MNRRDYNFGHYPWFRVYSEMVDDEKIRLLAFEDRWHYIALLCCKGKGLLDDDQEQTLMRRKVAIKLGLDMNALMEATRRLSEVGLIHAETWQPINWDKRQFNSDRDPTRQDRKSRFMEKKKGGTHLERIWNGCQSKSNKEDSETNLLIKDIRDCDISVLSAVNSCSSEVTKAESVDSVETLTLTSPTSSSSLADPGLGKKAFAWRVASIYHEVLPELSKVIAMTDKRVHRIIKLRDGKPGIGPDLENWRAYFDLVRQDDWTMGRVSGSRGTRFKASMDYVLSESVFVKISELYS